MLHFVYNFHYLLSHGRIAYISSRASHIVEHTDCNFHKATDLFDILVSLIKSMYRRGTNSKSICMYAYFSAVCEWCADYV